jgi:hypothetical protein
VNNRGRSLPIFDIWMRQQRALLSTKNDTAKSINYLLNRWAAGSVHSPPVDPQAWLADLLARLPDHPANKVADLLPWNWKANQQSTAALAACALRGILSRLPWVLAGCVRSATRPSIARPDWQVLARAVAGHASTLRRVPNQSSGA